MRRTHDHDNPVLSVRPLFLLVLFPLLILSAVGLKCGDAGASEPNAVGHGIDTFVLPDHTLDVEGLRRAGAAGDLDLSGYRLSLDSMSGSIEVRQDPDRGAPSEGDENWWDGFGSPGVNDEVRAMAVYNSTLVMAGSFLGAGGVQVNRIASWDGTAWSALGSGLNEGVGCLHVHDGKLIVGGWFNQAGGVSANYIAQWDGSSWSALGAGFNWVVQALATYDGELIAAGEFVESGGQPVNRIARWDGSSWLEFGGGADNTVTGLGVFGTELVAGGWFDNIGGSPISKVAKWDGSTWSAMGAWPVWDAPQSFEIYQTEFYGACWDNVLRWDGTVWVNTSFPGYGYGRSLTVFDDKLVATGWGGSRIYAWDGSSWAPIGSGLGFERGIATAVYDGDLYAGGYFLSVEDANVLNVAVWNGTSWSGVGPAPSTQGIGGYVNALAVYQGDVIAAGTFTVAGGVPVNNIARWDGTSWHPLAGGVTGWDHSVRALLVHDGFLVVGGAFDYAGTTLTPGLARWDGSVWGSFGQLECGGVSSLAEYQGDLVVGGWFCRIGGVEANRIARRDTYGWHSLGSGLGECDVRAITVHGDDLIAGGCFTTANGGPGDHVARWDGTSWSPLGSGLSGDVWALADYEGVLVAGGYFDLGDGYYDLGAWDGNSWVPFGGSFGGGVRSLAVVDGDLYAGGGFGGIGWGPPASHIARYDGYGWNALGSGVGGGVLAITGSEDPTGAYLYVGGELTRAGDGLLSAGIARWRIGDTVRPTLTSVSDVPNDQGRQVRLHWRRCAYDAPGQPFTITGYAIFREQSDLPALRNPTTSGQAEDDGLLRFEGWDYITTVPAFGDTTYQCVVPTLCDSTISGGLCLSTFMVRAATNDPFEYFDSAPLSGYSVDNLAPGPPANLRFADLDLLAWDEAPELDFDYFAVYGSPSEEFDPLQAELIGYTTTPEMAVPGVIHPYLHVTATDSNGNRGDPAAIQNETTGMSEPASSATQFEFYPCRPNPSFGSTTLRFALPAESEVVIRLYDVQGRERATLVRGQFPAGMSEVEWSADSGDGGTLPAGTYLCRLESGSFTRSRRLQVLGR